MLGNAAGNTGLGGGTPSTGITSHWVGASGRLRMTGPPLSRLRLRERLRLRRLRSREEERWRRRSSRSRPPSSRLLLRWSLCAGVGGVGVLLCSEGVTVGKLKQTLIASKYSAHLSRLSLSLSLSLSRSLSRLSPLSACTTRREVELSRAPPLHKR